jgi:hypothetical protein
MTLPQAEELFAYWRQNPPEHELLSTWLKAATDWEAEPPPMTEEERQAQHRASLERRWKSGHYLSPRQIWEAFGGKVTPPKGAAVAPGTSNILRPDKFPGIGPFPGAAY